MGNVHHGLFTVIARHSTQNGQSNLSADLPLSIYRHELTKDCKVTSVHSIKIYRGADKSLAQATQKKNFMLSIQPGLRGSNDLRVGRKMATFQLFFFLVGSG